jgi:Transglutaminase-like superfamily
VLLPWIASSLRIRGFHATQASLEKLLLASNKAVQLGPSRIAEVVGRTARMVRAAAHYGVHQPTCLQRSLALWYLLRRQGIASQLRIGARKIEGQFEAHPWIEVDGTALNEVDEPHRHYAASGQEFSALPPEVR